jgi:ribosome-binding factor A
MTKPYKRSDRVSENIKKTVFEIIKDIKDFNLYFITITNVKLSIDLLHCKVYYSVFGSKKEKSEVVNIFKENIKKIRHEIALRLNFKYTPEMYFIYDDTNEKATKILDILERIKN